MLDINFQLLQPYDGLDNRAADKLNYNFSRLKKILNDSGNIDVTTEKNIESVNSAIININNQITNLTVDIQSIHNEIEELNKKLESILDDLNYKVIIDKIYPIGSVYLSFSNINPSTMFGGEWEQITGNKYLRLANDTETGGSNSWTGSHTHTQNTHSHTLSSHTHNYSTVISHSHKLAPASNTTSTNKDTTTEIWVANYGAGNIERVSNGYYGMQLSDLANRSTSSTGSASGTTAGPNTANTSSVAATNQNTSITVTIEPVFQDVYAWKRIA